MIIIVTLSCSHIIVYSLADYDFLRNGTASCPLDSPRSLTGRNGLALRHVIDFGPLYHLIEPRPLNSWTVEGESIDITNSHGINYNQLSRSA